MRKSTQFSFAATLLMGVVAVPALAADMSSPCKDVVFDTTFITRYPYAPAACQDVTVKNSKKVVKFSGRVSKVEKGDISVSFLNVRGSTIEGAKDLTFTATPEMDFSVNGKKVKAKDLKVGDSLNFYVPEGRLGLVMDPDSTTIIPIK